MTSIAMKSYTITSIPSFIVLTYIMNTIWRKVTDMIYMVEIERAIPGLTKLSLSLIIYFMHCIESIYSLDVITWITRVTHNFPTPSFAYRLVWAIYTFKPWVFRLYQGLERSLTIIGGTTCADRPQTLKPCADHSIAGAGGCKCRRGVRANQETWIQKACASCLCLCLSPHSASF